MKPQKLSQVTQEVKNDRKTTPDMWADVEEIQLIENVLQQEEGTIRKPPAEQSESDEIFNFTHSQLDLKQHTNATKPVD